MQVKREVLLGALDSVQAGLAQREIIEQSTCFVFQDGTISTFNDNIVCRVPSPLGKEVTGAVKAPKLLEQLSKWQDDEDIDVSHRNGELVISARRKRMGVGMEHEITLPLDQIEVPRKFKPLHADFLEAISFVQECTGTDEARFALTCVHVCPEWVEACDGFQLTRFKLRTGIKPTLLRREATRHATALGMSEFAETPSWFHFRNANGLVLSCRRYTDVSDYPDLGELLEVKGSPVALPKGLAKAADNAEVFSRDNVDNNYVTVSLKPGKVKIEGRGVNCWYHQVMTIKSYDGPPICFQASPKLLRQLMQKFNDCIISEDRLAVKSNRFAYVASLDRVSKVKEGKPIKPNRAGKKVDRKTKSDEEE